MPRSQKSTGTKVWGDAQAPPHKAPRTSRRLFSDAVWPVTSFARFNACCARVRYSSRTPVVCTRAAVVAACASCSRRRSEKSCSKRSTWRTQRQRCRDAQGETLLLRYHSQVISPFISTTTCTNWRAYVFPATWHACGPSLNYTVFSQSQPIPVMLEHRPNASA